MSGHIWAFVAAGCVGTFVAIFHGLVTQKWMIKPILKEVTLPDSTRNLIPLLLHFSTICWFFGGIALIITPFWLSPPAMLTTAVFVGAFYTVGAVGNFWGTKGRHPGWMMLAVAVGLIGYASAPMI